jgi:ER-bound oxygenase mpaB/B'/Rubber oxygenase, catalytic domain
MTGRHYSNEFLDSLREQVDPLADQVVAEHFAQLEDGDPRQLLSQLVLGDGLGGSSPVQAYLDRPLERPDWLDPTLLAAGQECFARWGSHVFTALYAAALPSAYACCRGVQVLGLTARLVTDPKRRLNETAQFHLDVMEPNGLQAGSRGFSDVRHVRLMHAAVRWLIAHDPHSDWDPQWGQPINQEDMLETLLTFTEIVFEVFDRTGVVYSDQDAEAYLHAWSYIGFLLGVHPDLLPLTRADTRNLMPEVRRRQFATSAAGIELMAALLEQGRQVAPPGLRGLPATTVRFYVGDATADLLSVPPADWTRALFGPLARVTRVFSAEKAHRVLLRNLSDRMGLGMLQLAVTAERGGQRPAFAIPTQLADRWGVSSIGVPRGGDHRRARRAASR